MLVVGDGLGTGALRRDLSRLNGTAPEIVGVVARRQVPARDGWRDLGDLAMLPELVARLRISDLAVCLHPEEWPHIEWLARVSSERGIRMSIPIAPSSATRATSEAARAAKRAIDLGLSALGLVLAAPIIALGALAVLVADGRPVFFRQQRAGLHGRPFSILKLRTMERGADERRSELRTRNEVTGGAFKMTDDPRVMRVGRWLRRLSIDELPQLWNVLMGDMSLVGPRPHPFDDVAGYEPWHVPRLAVKPGVTGLWQVELRTDPDFDLWVQKDLEYIDRWSIWLDLKIMARTIPAIVRGTGR